MSTTTDPAVLGGGTPPADAPPKEGTAPADAPPKEGTAPATPPDAGTKTSDDPGTKTGEGEPATPESKVPEKYELKAPEGIQLDATALQEVTPLFKEMGVSQEQAQKLADFSFKLQQAQESAVLARLQAESEKQQKDWVDELRSDPEFGGSNFEPNARKLAALWDRFDAKDNAAGKAIREAGMANHPAIVRLFHNIAKALGEDSIAGTPSAGGGTKSDEEVMRTLYPSMYGKQE